MTNPPRVSRLYRPDIDGMRALAVVRADRDLLPASHARPGVTDWRPAGTVVAQPGFRQEVAALPPWAPRVLSLIGPLSVLGSLLWFDSQFGERIADILRENNISTVILVANWSAYIKRRKLQYSDIGATTARLRSLHQRVILVGQSPVFPFAYPDEYFFRTFGSDERARDYYAPPDLDPAINDRIVAAAGADIDVFFDPLKLLCHQFDCLFKQGGSYLFIDYGHYSLYGSQIVATALMRAAGYGTPGGNHAPGYSASPPSKLKSSRTGSRPG